MLMTAAGWASAAPGLQCHSQRRMGGGEGLLQMAVQAQFEGGEMVAVALDTTSVALATNTGATCSAAFKRGAPYTTWRREGRALRIATSEAEVDGPSALVVQRSRQGYVLDLAGLSRASCGARADWPSRVVVPLQGGVCRTGW
jgi:hypothetical protein